MLQFRLLGPLEVHAQGRAVPIGGPRQRAVLARLLVDAGRVVSTDALVDAVWGDRPPPTALKTLQKYVVELRKAIGPDVLRTQGRGYVVEVEDEQVDARSFESLVNQADGAESAGEVERGLAMRAEAERLWRGRVLADFPDAAFVAPVQARLNELRLSSLETVLELELARGHHLDVAARAAELVERQPLRERLWSSLMLALYRSGRHAEALRAYGRYRHMLAEELGLEPSEALRGLEVSILRQDPTLAQPSVDLGAHATGNLSQPPTSLIGRTSEVSAVEAALREHRIVTLTGTGGVGKTRLAIEAAHRVALRYPGGCWFVELAAVSDADLVVRVVTDVLSIDEHIGEDLIDSLATALSYRQATLVVLDNCEHLLRASAVIADKMLLRVPGLTVLATSRQRLGVDGEHVIAVGPLPVVGEAAQGHPPALQLFVERAREAAPGIELAGGDLDAATQVCERLDGIPLAIELAASQLRVLEPAQIVARLDDRLRFAAATTVSSARQRTLDAAVSWSYELLTEAARAVFDRLAVFSESCTLEAAEALATSGLAGADVLGAITELVDGSLLIRERSPTPEARYRLLETLRLYGLHRLELSGALGEARRAHALYYLGLAQAGRPHLFGPAELTWKRRLEAEDANLRAAIAWASRHDADLAARLCVALWPYWSMGWRNAEGLGYLRPLLEDHGPAGAAAGQRAWALTAAASLSAETGEARLALAWAKEAIEWFGSAGDEGALAQAHLALGSALGNQGKLEAAENVLSGVLAYARAADDRVLLALTLEASGLVAARRGDHEEARRRHLLEAEVWANVDSVTGQSTAWLLLASAARSTGDLDGCIELGQRAIEGFESRHNRAGVAHALSPLADAARLKGDTEAAELTYARALAAFQESGDRRCLASTYKNLAVIANERGDYDRAGALFLDSMRLRHALGDDAGLSECLEGLAATALATEGTSDAVMLLAASSMLRAATGATALPEDRALVDHLVVQGKRRLDRAAFREAWAAGERLDSGNLISFVAGRWESQNSGPAPGASEP